MGIESIQQMNLAGTGQLPNAQPGQRGPLGILPGLQYQTPFDLSGLGLGGKPIPGIGGIFANGGAFNPKGMGLIQKLAASIREDAARAAQGAAEYMRMAASDVQQSHPGQVYGQAPRSGGGGFSLE